MGIFSELFDVITKPRTANSKVHIGTVDKRTGEYKNYESSPMPELRAEIAVKRMNREIDRRILRGEIKKNERPEIWVERNSGEGRKRK